MPLNHTLHGKGLPVVLLHGFCESLKIWDTFIKPLTQQAQTVAIDLPGFGENQPLQQASTIEEMADQVYRTLQELGVVSGVLVGHSLGGYVSLAFAEKYPQWMQGLCLFHSTAYADSSAKKEKRDKAIRFIQENGIQAFNDGLIPSLFASSRRDAMRDTIEEVKAITNQTSARTATEVTLTMKNRPDRTDVLKRANYSVMFIAGREDEAVPLSDVQFQSSLPNGAVHLHVLPDVGHMGMYEEPELTRMLLENFVERASVFS